MQASRRELYSAYTGKATPDKLQYPMGTFIQAIYPSNRISVQEGAELWIEPYFHQIRYFLSLTIYMKGLRSKNPAAPMMGINILVLDQNKYSLILQSKEFAYTY